MQKITGRLTVYFEAPYWVGVYERVADGGLEAAKIIFGAQPKEYQVYTYLLENWHRLRFGPAVAVQQRAAEHKNPKRVQREITRQLAGHGAGTKSQQALQQQRENAKLIRRRRSREERETEARRLYRQRQLKKKEKKRGH